MSEVELVQEHRLAKVKSGITSDVIVVNVAGLESISAEFEFDVDILSDDHSIDAEALIATAVVLEVAIDDSKKRVIKGLVSHCSIHGVDESGLRHYRLKLVSPLWFIQYSSNNRIFQQKTAKKIIEEVLAKYGFELTVSFQTQAQMLERNYCVQYDESDYDFIHRLLSEEGVGYFYIHTDSKLEIVFYDASNSYQKCAPYTVEYAPAGTAPFSNTVSRWHRELNYRPKKYHISDYNSFSSTAETLKKSNVSSSSMGGVTAVEPTVDARLPSKAKEALRTETPAKELSSYLDRWLESEEARFEVAYGESDCSFLKPGFKFKLNHPVESEAKEYLVIEVVHSLQDSNNTDTTYSNRFKCICADQTYRPNPRHSERTQVNSHIAFVTQVATEKHKDPYKQVKVTFAWDNNAESVWLRSVQPFAGNDWGAVFVPRVGQEVVINYIGGNVERPVVSGAVYNPSNQFPAYTQTQSGFKTKDEGMHNELRFDDKKDAEEVYFEAGKDHNFLINNDQKGDIKGLQTVAIEKDRNYTIKGNDTLSIEGNQGESVKGNQQLTIKGNHAVKVSGNDSTDVTGSIKTSSKSTISIQAATSIELKVGGSSIKLSNAGIDIKAIKISAAANAMAEIKSSGILTLKGSLTQIN
ncbi:Actin cross-linking toxin VgrG1 [Sinobacterium norvegicum]|uniref:Actin cross-linking toxin VgrG1 n=1 Tax=Sinobacterium norvegicum TaxID=1641715 RepID=A0ABM9AAH9_9GAMM|nr:type VI secretion system tip protein TssI/VgrG [Sinobacterium norvegicum]CAH0990134.1 Actin cross-linking toxin VgrG1 [Sinobacterium norvegicum]